MPPTSSTHSRPSPYHLAPLLHSPVRVPSETLTPPLLPTWLVHGTVGLDSSGSSQAPGTRGLSANPQNVASPGGLWAGVAPAGSHLSYQLLDSSPKATGSLGTMLTDDDRHMLHVFQVAFDRSTFS